MLVQVLWMIHEDLFGADEYDWVKKLYLSEDQLEEFKSLLQAQSSTVYKPGWTPSFKEVFDPSWESRGDGKVTHQVTVSSYYMVAYRDDARRMASDFETMERADFDDEWGGGNSVDHEISPLEEL